MKISSPMSVFFFSDRFKSVLMPFSDFRFQCNIVIKYTHSVCIVIFYLSVLSTHIIYTMTVMGPVAKKKKSV